MAEISSTARGPGPEPAGTDPFVITRFAYKSWTGINDNRRWHIYVVGSEQRQFLAPPLVGLIALLQKCCQQLGKSLGSQYSLERRARDLDEHLLWEFLDPLDRFVDEFYAPDFVSAGRKRSRAKLSSWPSGSRRWKYRSPQVASAGEVDGA